LNFAENYSQLSEFLIELPPLFCRKPYDFKIDIWSFGITLIEMIDGEAPYKNEEPSQIFNIIARNERPNIQKYEQLSDELKSFLGVCLVVDARDRATARDLLNHMFLNGHSVPVTADVVKKNTK
jgi:protein-serine/threonine kinase